MKTTFFEFFKGIGKKKISFYIITLLSLIAIIISIVLFGYQFVFFKEKSKEGKIYMNLSEDATRGTCASEPFVHHLPISFTYKTPLGDYSFVCQPEVILQFIGHVAVTFSYVFFAVCSYVFGIVAVQRKVVYFLPIWALVIISMFVVGIYEIIVVDENTTFCKNDLIYRVFNETSYKYTSPQVTYPTGIECHMAHYTNFGIVEIVTAVYGIVVCIIITIAYVFYRREKARQRFRDEYKNMELERQEASSSKTNDPVSRSSMPILGRSATQLYLNEQPTSDDDDEHVLQKSQHSNHSSSDSTSSKSSSSSSNDNQKQKLINDTVEPSSSLN